MTTQTHENMVLKKMRTIKRIQALQKARRARIKKVSGMRIAIEYASLNGESVGVLADMIREFIPVGMLQAVNQADSQLYICSISSENCRLACQMVANEYRSAGILLPLVFGEVDQWVPFGKQTCRSRRYAWFYADLL